MSFTTKKSFFVKKLVFPLIFLRIAYDNQLLSKINNSEHYLKENNLDNHIYLYEIGK